MVSNRVANTPLDSPRLILAGPTAQDKALGDSALLECLPSRDNLRVSWTRSGKVHSLSVSLLLVYFVPEDKSPPVLIPTVVLPHGNTT